GRLVAWGASSLALAWSADDVESALVLAASVVGEPGSAAAPGRAWSAGIAEGELDPLDPVASVAGAAGLAWGRPLLSAASLVRLARAGEALVDNGLTAFRDGRVSVLDERSGTDAGEAGERVGGWRLDLEHPWMTLESPQPPRNGALAEHIRKAVRGDESAAAVEALARLRRARARAEGGAPATRCQAALALGMMLSIAGRSEEALLEALDALARAKEAQDGKAVSACTALLAKLYAAQGLSAAAGALRDGAGL
ncbi:MAG: hypothetical protein JOZ69_22870, partial [Myxococcales bacterium]|nr:hypothetical protein [Myxococcales bacterium]